MKKTPIQYIQLSMFIIGAVSLAFIATYLPEITYFTEDYRFYLIPLRYLGGAGGFSAPPPFDAVILFDDSTDLFGNSTYYTNRVCQHEICHKKLYDLNLSMSQHEEVCYKLMWDLEFNDCYDLQEQRGNK